MVHKKDTKRTHKYILIIIVDNELYQSGKNGKDKKKTHNGHPMDTQWTDNGQTVSRDSNKNNYSRVLKKVKNLKNDKKSTITMSQINNLISQFPSNLQSFINEYIDIARLQNKTEKISLYRQKRLLNELLLLWNKYNTDNDTDKADYRKALKITINNQAPNINYVRKVIQGIVNKRSMRMKKGIISS